MDGIWYFVLLVIGILALFAITYTNRILKTHLPELLYFISTFIFFFADVKSDSSEKFVTDYSWKDLNNGFITLGCLTYFIGLFFSYVRSEKYTNAEELKRLLQQEVEKKKLIREEYYSLCSDNIKHIFHAFVSTTHGNGRVSIYKHHGAYFKLLGRYSPNPNYNKRSNENYPDDEGFISSAWQNGSFRIDSIPAWQGRGRDYIEYVTQINDIDVGRLRGISMKSRSFYIRRIDEPNHAHNPLGIIVFEKMDPTVVDENMIDQTIATFNNQLMFLLKSMKSLDRIEGEV